MSNQQSSKLQIAWSHKLHDLDCYFSDLNLYATLKLANKILIDKIELPICKSGFSAFDL
jgi:hypothetical protein